MDAAKTNLLFGSLWYSLGSLTPSRRGLSLFRGLNSPKGFLIKLVYSFPIILINMQKNPFPKLDPEDYQSLQNLRKNILRGSLLNTLAITASILIPAKILTKIRLFQNPLKSPSKSSSLLRPLLLYTMTVPIFLLNLFYFGGKFKTELERQTLKYEPIVTAFIDYRQAKLRSLIKNN